MNGQDRYQQSSTSGYSLLDQRLVSLHEDVVEMRDVLRELTTAIVKLALIEQQQAVAAQAQERAFMALERVEGRVAAIERAIPEKCNERLSAVEKNIPELTRSSQWVYRGVWAAVTVVALVVARKAGLV